MTRQASSTIRFCIVFLCISLLVWSGASCSPKPEPTGPCKTNTDCAGSKICKAGECVFPEQEKTTEEKTTEEKTTEITAEPAKEPTIEPITEPGKEPVAEPGKEPVADASEPVPENGETIQEEPPQDTSVGCKSGDTRPCYTGTKDTEGKGECQAGTQKCVGGFWDVSCEGEVLPSREECNGKDDNCDGKIDESFPEDGNNCKLAGKQGPCAQGAYVCQADVLVCKVTYQSKPEDCSNKIDDDCDGKIDGPPCKCNPTETRDCYTGDPKQATQGECRKGRQICDSQGQWGTCAGEKLPGTETCNGKDDDCDGQTDESFPEKGSPCTDTSKQGNCKQGSYTKCSNGALVCESQVQPAPKEICNNGKDDDCNGKTDENPPCQCKKGQLRSCYNGTPGTDRYLPCKRGTQTCDSNGQWGSCAGEVTGKPETCDNIDNDCNGKIDDNLSQVCSSNCGKGTEICEKGKYIRCTAPQPTAEICDGKDNDCDSYIDNAKGVKKSYTLTQSCSNRCGKGIETCSTGGKWANCNAPTPVTETCNNKDDDCDGYIDDNLSQTCFGTGLSGCILNRLTNKWSCKGTCKTGQKVCKAGVYSSTCSGDIGAITEVCRDGKDNDCDGITDEICGAAYAYASVGSAGNTIGKRYITSTKKVSTGIYLISAYSGYGCDQRPIFAVGATSSMVPVSFTCSGTNHIVSLGAHATRTGAKQDYNFYAVIPRKEANTEWGVFSCPATLSRCSVSKRYGSISIRRTGTGSYDLSSTRCKTAKGPLFASIYSSKLTGYAVAYYSNSLCRVRTYNLSGKLVDLPFAFWAPNLDTSAYAVVDAKGSVILSQTFKDSRAKWSAKYSASRLIYYDVTFPAWSKLGAALVQPFFPVPYHLAPSPITGGVRVYSRDIPSALYRTSQFTIMFVQ